MKKGTKQSKQGQTFWPELLPNEVRYMTEAEFDVAITKLKQEIQEIHDNRTKEDKAEANAG